MDKARYQLNSRTAGALTVPMADAEKLLALSDGEAALLYLHILRAGGELHTDLAAAELNRTAEQIRAAAAALAGAGLLTKGDAPLPPPEELPEYRAEDILRRSREDGTFSALVTEAQRVLGHSLSGADLKTLFGIYDHLGMPSDVIMLLINHCADRLRKRYGESRLPSMRTVEKEAFYWARQEILTLEQAEEYLAGQERLARESEELRRVLQITDRDYTATERKYVDSWLAMGFGIEALALAYDRTVVGAGKLAWPYMNKILLSWYEKGLFTVEDIEKGDARPQSRRRGASASAESAAPRGDDSDRLAALLNLNRK